MVLDVGRDVLVVGMRTLQAGIVRMRLWIVPVKLLMALPDLVTVPVDAQRQAIEDKPFQDDETEVVVEKDFSRNPCQRVSTANESEGRATDRAESLGEGI